MRRIFFHDDLEAVAASLLDACPRLVAFLWNNDVYRRNDVWDIENWTVSWGGVPEEARNIGAKTKPYFLLLRQRLVEWP